MGGSVFFEIPDWPGGLRDSSAAPGRDVLQGLGAGAVQSLRLREPRARQVHGRMAWEPDRSGAEFQPHLRGAVP